MMRVESNMSFPGPKPMHSWAFPLQVEVRKSHGNPVSMPSFIHPLSRISISCLNNKWLTFCSLNVGRHIAKIRSSKGGHKRSFSGHHVGSINFLFKEQFSVAFVIRGDVGVRIVHARWMNGVPSDGTDWLAIRGAHNLQEEHVLIRVVSVPERWWQLLTY